jgi:hypothetical protein
VDAADADLAAARRTMEDFSLAPPGPGPGPGPGRHGPQCVKGCDGGGSGGDLNSNGSGGGGGDDDDDDGGVVSEFQGTRPSPPGAAGEEWVRVAVEDLAAALAAAREALKPKVGPYD